VVTDFALALWFEARYTVGGRAGVPPPEEATMRVSTVLPVLGFSAVAVAVAVALAVATPADAETGTRIQVSLAGRDDGIPKLGLPGIAVRVDAPDPAAAASVVAELERELAEQVITRPLATDEPGDYELDVKLGDVRAESAVRTVRFEAILVSTRGERLWRVEGRTETEGAPLDAAVFAGISRNVVSALAPAGGPQPRLDPDNPPPQPPRVRIAGDDR
jgi:hypothetical protein